MTNLEIKEKLFSLSDASIKEFSAKLTPTEENIIGVRVPLIKNLAKEIAKGDYKKYLESPATYYHEECLLYGLVIGYIKEDLETVISYFDEWLDFIKNWAVCDSSVMNIKIFKLEKNRARVWDYLVGKLQTTDKPFIKRAIIVTLYSFIEDENYINKIKDVYCSIKDDHYYVKMAIAWGVSIIAAKNYNTALLIFKKKLLSIWTHNKSIQKCIESFRISKEQKIELKALKY